MKQQLLASAMMAAALTAGAADLTLTFERTGVTAADVTVTAAGIDGVTAELTAISHNMFALDETKPAIGPSILVIQKNRNSLADGESISWTLKINGLSQHDYISSAKITFEMTDLNGIYQNGMQGTRTSATSRLVGENPEALTSIYYNETFDLANPRTNDTELKRCFNEATFTPTATPWMTSKEYFKIDLAKNNDQPTLSNHYGISKVELTIENFPVETYIADKKSALTNSGLFAADDLAAFDAINPDETATKDELEAAVSEVESNLYKSLSGRNYTLKSNSTGRYAAVSGDNLMLVSEPTGFNHYWTLNHVEGNKFTITNPNSQKSIKAYAGNLGGSNSVEVTDAAEKTQFAIEPYSDSNNYANCVAIACTDHLGDTGNPNGPRAYLHDDQNANTQVKYWFNKKDTEPTHASVAKGAWVLAEHTGATTAIREISAEAPAAKPIYDLQGRRIAAPAKGINIINGRKVFVGK